MTNIAVEALQITMVLRSKMVHQNTSPQEKAAGWGYKSVFIFFGCFLSSPITDSAMSIAASLNLCGPPASEWITVLLSWEEETARKIKI